MNIPVQATPTSFPLCALARSGLADSQGDPSSTNGGSRRHFLPLLFPLLLLFFLTSLAPSTAVSAPLSSLPDLLASSACDPISADAVWTAGVYTATNCHVIVPAGVTLPLQPGVIVKFNGVSPGYGSGPGSTGLIVNGILNAVGSAAQPVVFTSLKDDGHGGDSGGDGATTGAAGEWYGLVFKPGSVGRLEYFFVGYAGSGAFSSGYGYNRAQIDVNSADVQLRQGTVTDGLQIGIYLDGTDITPVMADVHVADNHMGNSAGYAVYQHIINMQPTYSNLTFAGNDRNEVTVRVSDAMTRSVTWGGSNYGFVCGYTLCLLTVPGGKTLTVEPGTALDFRPAYGIAVADGASLIAQGTVTQPITFTSQLAAAGTPHQNWIGPWAQHRSTLRLEDERPYKYEKGDEARHRVARQADEDRRALI